MNKIKIKRTIIIAFLIAILIATPVYSQIGYVISLEQLTQEKVDYIKTILSMVKGYYIKDLTYDELIDSMFDGLFKNLDKYSAYMKPQEANEFTQSVNGEIYGIGVQIEQQDDNIVVIAVFDNTPAKEAGIKVGDKIIAVNGESLIGKDVNYAASKIRGLVDTTVTVDVLRDGSTYSFTMIRRKIKIPVVEYKIIDNKIGYIKLSQFTQNSSVDVKNALNEFDKKNIRKVIFDVRNNPGGYLDEVVKMAEYFVPEGPIVTIEYRGSKDEYKSKNKFPKYRVAVLANESSASASEIFAQAIKDTGVGVVIGNKTYGKGTVQVTIPVNKPGYMVKLTVAKYKSPKGYYVDGKGVQPNIVVNDDSLKDYGPDKILPLSAKNRYKKGDTSLEILAAQQRLYYLGYTKTLSTTLDTVTFEAIKKFQKDNKLTVYGGLDISTQKKLIEKFNEFLKAKYVDKQLNEAINYLNKN
ncbi:S41 family peptidase [Caldicellulosiruptoraceae bacterium PP1]